MMMRKGKEDAAAHKTDDFGISIFILFLFCSLVNELVKAQKNCVVTSWTQTQNNIFFLRWVF
jgi:hypothetical protein